MIDLAIKRSGGVCALAKAIGVSPPSICGWKKRGKIPAERVVLVEKASGIDRSKLRPDLFPSGVAA
ncbi:hypothetical protein HLH26_15775 [Gluconacetobacter sp. 1b LMG 1731]|uniref:Helix-turn-helix domain-containing protein n=1 Tax=Gluconacetobacter dulcium TaxID=2729096 RepID=A0A7W4INR5_9PROT|nr:YdaS family helix-turn-helix protein [Gluconacetobacter dulcium]MBB2165962.1 hypothetical protein [Gluconacetobacter dulcium]MBB2195099.1 hypothetical protein [Gluconacetobacter dulcium]